MYTISIFTSGMRIISNKEYFERNNINTNEEIFLNKNDNSNLIS